MSLPIAPEGSSMTFEQIYERILEIYTELRKLPKKADDILVINQQKDRIIKIQVDRSTQSIADLLLLKQMELNYHKKFATKDNYHKDMTEIIEQQLTELQRIIDYIWKI